MTLSKKERANAARNSKRKGGNYEREVAAAFTKVLYPDGIGEVRRVPGSGGIKTMVRYDIKAYSKIGNDPEFDKKWNLHLECKLRTNLDFLGMFTGNSDTPLMWYLEANIKSENMVTVLVFRKAGITQSYYMLEAKGFETILSKEYKAMWFYGYPFECMEIDLANKHFIIGRLEDFIEYYNQKYWGK